MCDISRGIDQQIAFQVDSGYCMTNEGPVGYNPYNNIFLFQYSKYFNFCKICFKIVAQGLKRAKITTPGRLPISKMAKKGGA